MAPSWPELASLGAELRTIAGNVLAAVAKAVDLLLE
jgi:hypothetical protein